MPTTVDAQPQLHNYDCGMDVDLVTAVQLAGLALTDEAVRRLHAAGHADLRTSHGYLVQHVVEGPRPIGEIAARMGVTQQAVSKTVGELVVLGYLDRTADPVDARVRLVGLSDRGRAAVAATRRIRDDIQRELGAVLGEERAAALHESALAALEWAGGGGPMRARQVRQPT
jgi:DNA-binding MarR family transcriptional regulator